jgi:hypothetical protein
MADDRSEPRHKKVALLLSSLALTPDAGLAALRRRGADPELDDELLKKARALGDAVGHAILSRDAARWRRIADAARLLERDAREAPEEGATGAANEAAPPPASAPQRTAAPPRAAPPSFAHPPPPTRPPVALRAVPIPAAPLDTTTEGQRIDFGDALPFREGPSAAPPASVAEPPHEAVGETAFFSGPLVDEPAPFPLPEPTTEPLRALPPALTLEQYASLCAEAAERPADAAAVCARYGVHDAAQLGMLDEGWRRRFLSDPSLHARFEQHVAHYRDWLARR